MTKERQDIEHKKEKDDAKVKAKKCSGCQLRKDFSKEKPTTRREARETVPIFLTFFPSNLETL